MRPRLKVSGGDRAGRGAQRDMFTPHHHQRFSFFRLTQRSHGLSTEHFQLLATYVAVKSVLISSSPIKYGTRGLQS